MSQLNEFNNAVRATEAELTRAVIAGRYPSQPKAISMLTPDGDSVLGVEYLYLVSLRNLAFRTTAGAVVMTNLRNAAIALTSNTHTLASGDQIRQYLEDGKERYRQRLIEDSKINKPHTFEIKLPETTA